MCLLAVPVVFGHGELQLQLEGSAGTLAGAPCEREHPTGGGHQVVPSCVQQHHHSLVEASQGGHWGTYPWASYPPKQCQCCGVLQYTQSPSWYSPTQSSFALELGTAASRSHKCSQSFRPLPQSDKRALSASAIVSSLVKGMIMVSVRGKAESPST